MNKKIGVKIISIFMIWLIALLPITLAVQETTKTKVSEVLIKAPPRGMVCYLDEISDKQRAQTIIASSNDIDEVIERLRIANAYKPFKRIH